MGIANTLRSHCHLVTIINAPGEAFVRELMELAPLYGFGTSLQPPLTEESDNLM